MKRTRTTRNIYLLVSLLSELGLFGQLTRPDEIKRLEGRLQATIEWEILWDSSPKGFRFRPNQPTNVAIYSQLGFLSYCSRDLALCVQYATPVRRYWEFGKSLPHSTGRRDEDVLLEFVGAATPPVKIDAPRRHVEGILEPTDGLSWTTTITLLSRDRILELYRNFHPGDLESLRDQLKPLVVGGRYKSLTIPCYRKSDFYVPIYGQRTGNGSVVFGVFWDPDAEMWVESGVMARAEDNPERAETFRKQIMSIKCATVGREQ